MVSTLKSILAVAIIASVACSTYAIQCYQCESLSNPKCGKNFESEENFKFDCSRIAPPRYIQAITPFRNATGCMKKTMESSNDHPQIIRTCYFGDISNTQNGCQSDPSLPFVRQLSCDVCTGNLCNAAGSTAPIALAILFFFIMARMLH